MADYKVVKASDLIDNAARAAVVDAKVLGFQIPPDCVVIRTDAAPDRHERMVKAGARLGENVGAAARRKAKKRQRQAVAAGRRARKR